MVDESVASLGETRGQRLTARFFLRFSQENSSSSEKSCSSSSVHTNMSITEHIYNPTAQTLSQNPRILQELLSNKPFISGVEIIKDVYVYDKSKYLSIKVQQWA